MFENSTLHLFILCSPKIKHEDAYETILRPSCVMKWRKIHIRHGICVCMKQWHSLALSATVLQRQYCQTESFGR